MPEVRVPLFHDDDDNNNNNNNNSRLINLLAVRNGLSVNPTTVRHNSNSNNNPAQLTRNTKSAFCGGASRAMTTAQASDHERQTLSVHDDKAVMQQSLELYQHQQQAQGYDQECLLNRKRKRHGHVDNSVDVVDSQQQEGRQAKRRLCSIGQKAEQAKRPASPSDAQDYLPDSMTKGGPWTEHVLRRLISRVTKSPSLCTSE